jgi:hypothetical protein
MLSNKKKISNKIKYLCYNYNHMQAFLIFFFTWMRSQWYKIHTIIRINLVPNILMGQEVVTIRLSHGQ